MFKLKIKPYLLSIFTLPIILICSCNRLEIVVPDGFTGAVYLLKSKVPENILTVDSNGIGYLNEKTFDALKWEPHVHSVSGKDLSSNLVGYNPSAFWARGEYESIKPKLKIQYMGFEIVPDHRKGEKQYYSKELFQLVDTSKVK